MPDDGTDDTDGFSSVSRRALIRSAAATTALPFVGAAAADDDEGPVPDEPLPGPTVAPVGFDCSEDDTGDYTTVSREPTHDFGEERVVELDSATDGEKIQLGFVKPEPLDGGKGGDYPVILRATPYVSDLRKPDSIRDCVRIERLTENFVQQGYAVAVVAVRGTGGSGGCIELMGPNEQADVDQAVTYLGERPWSNGNVGIVGRSYDGTTPWMVARRGNPHLATIVPYSGVPDVFELMYKRGAPESRGYGVLNALYYLISLADHSPASGTGLATYLSRAQCPDNYAAGSAWSVYSGATGERDPSGYWTARVLKPGVARNYEGSILLVHGLQDWNVDPSQVYPWVDALQAAGIKTHLYLGQFPHRYPDDARQKDQSTYNEQWQDYLLAWFESELKGASYEGEFTEHDGIPDRNYDPVPEVYAQNSAGEWYVADEWPPADAAPRTLYLGTGGEVRESPDPETGEGRVYKDEAFESVEPGQRGTVTFTTPAFEERFRLAGAPELDLTVTPTSSAPHLTAHLFRVTEDGSASRLGWGQVDLRFAQDDPEGDTLTPGEPIAVSLPIEPLDAVVPAGERLAVVLSQGTVSGRTTSPTPTPVLVETGGDSALRLDAWGDDFGATGERVARGTRATDASAYTGGQTAEQVLTVDADPAAPVRDTVPASWTVLAEDSPDVTRTETEGGVTRVFFEGVADDRTRLSYLVEVPAGADASDVYTVGPAQVRQSGTWLDLDGTTAEAFVAGPSS